MQLSLKSIVVRLTAWSQDRVDTLYVGCGNRYDDDRRLVRVPIPPRPEPCALHREVRVLIDGRKP